MPEGKKLKEGGSSFYQIITVIGASPESWEKEAASAVVASLKNVPGSGD